MRFVALFSLILLGCAGHGEPAAQPRASGPTDPHAARPLSGSDSGDRTHIDSSDLVLDLPGRWDDHPIEHGHDLRMGNREQIIISLFPPIQGLDGPSSVARLAEAQQRGMASQCRHAAGTSTPTAASTPPRAMRFHVVCEEPPVVATFSALVVGGNVLSYEHYWYSARTFSPELDRADDTILATLHLKPTKAACPPAVLTNAAANGGICLETATLGKAVVEECRRALESNGWTQDDASADAIGHQTAKELVCYRKLP